MKHNLLEIFDDTVKPVLFEELKRENPSADKVIYQHLTIIHASILGGLIQKSKKPNGAKAIKNLIEKGSHTGEIIDRASTIFASEEKLSDVKKLGNSLLTFVFDDGADKAFEKIQYFLSEKYLTSEEELIDVNRMVAPFSIGLFGRMVHDENMSEEQITDILGENEPFISMRFPGLAKALGIKAATSVSVDDSSISTESAHDVDIPSPVQEQTNGASSGVKETVEEDRKLFLKSLWPWVALLVVSGLSLFILKKFETEPIQPKVRQDNPFNFIQRDSLVLSNQKSYTLPGNVLLEVKRYSVLDSLLYQLENNQSPVDTLRYVNSDIGFQDSTAILTSSANKELTTILTILQTYTDLKMDINLFYDKNFLAQNPAITDQQVKNLRDYFTVFGLDGSQFKVNKFTYQTMTPSPGTDTIEMDSSIIDPKPQLLKNKKVELLFYHNQPIVSDSLKIQK